MLRKPLVSLAFWHIYIIVYICRALATDVNDFVYIYDSLGLLALWQTNLLMYLCQALATNVNGFGYIYDCADKDNYI